MYKYFPGGNSGFETRQVSGLFGISLPNKSVASVKKMLDSG